MTSVLALLVLLAMGGWWWWRQRNVIVSEDGVSLVPTGDGDMQRAIAKAREDFHFFIARLHDPRPGDESFAIKAGITHDGHTEHIWLTDVRVDDDGFEGEIANDPQAVPFKCGDRWRGRHDQLSDWTYFSHGRMQGNFTLRAMLPRMPKADRERARAMLESHWDTQELAHLPWPPDAAMPGQPSSDAPSTGDSTLMEGVGEHLDAHFGKVERVFHEIVSPRAHIDLYPYPATHERPFHVVATTGMAEQPMRIPAGRDDSPFVELVLLLPSTWPLDQESWQEERHWWPLRWLKRVARYHYETGRWLGEGHLLTHGANPVPILPDVGFDSVLLAQPRALPESFQRVRLADGRQVHFLCLYFLDPAQRAGLGERGWEDYRAEITLTRLSL